MARLFGSIFEPLFRPVVRSWNATPSQGVGASGPPSPTAPAQFQSGDWSVADRNTVDGATITITNLPSNGGSAITALQYQVDGGSWSSLGGTTTGAYNISGLTFNTSQAIALRAVNSIGNGTASATKSVTPTGNSQVNALNAAFTTPMTTARAKLYQSLYNSLILGAISGSNILAKLDLLYIMAAADSQAARINLVNPSTFTLLAVNSPTFTADRGFQGDGATSYLKTGFIPSSAGGNWSQDSTIIGAWVNATGSDAANSSAADIGTSASFTTVLQVWRSTAAIGVTVNDGTSPVTVGSAIATRLGHTAVVRSASNLVTGYKAGASIGTSAVASTGLPVAEVYLLARNTSGTPQTFAPDRLAASYGGGALTANEEADVNNALSTFLTAIGAA